MPNRKLHLTRITAISQVLAAMIVAVIMICAEPLRASQDPQPRASIAASQTSVELGDSLIFQVTIDGASSADETQLAESDAYRAEFLGGRDESSHSISIINGRRSETQVSRYVMQWRITPQKAGRSAVEPFIIKADTGVAQVPRFEFSASESGENPNFQLSLQAERTSVYIGEPVHVKLVWTLGAGAKGAAFSGPDGGQVYDLEPLDPRPPRSRANQIQQNDPYRLVQFLDGKAIISRSQENRDGRNVNVFVAEVVITPRKSGKVTIGPYRVAFDEIIGQRAKSFFDSPFDDLSQTRRAVVASNPLTLDVKVLPEEGRPADFNGLIGVYSVETTSPTTQANVGDPIPLSLTIRGPEPLTSLKAPALESQPQFLSKFKAAPEGWESGGGTDDSGTSGKRMFTTTIRPKSDDVTEIPEFRLPYFDTATGKYEVARSKPLPLKVRPSKEITLADAIRPGAITAASVPVAGASQAKLTDAPAGLGANTETTDALINQRVSMLAMIQSPAGLVFIALPPIAMACSGILAIRRRTRDPLIAARRAALNAAGRELANANSLGEVTSALRTALSPFIGISDSSVTSQDIAQMHANVLSESTLNRASEVLRQLECAVFDSQSLDLETARSSALSVIQELKKS